MTSTAETLQSLVARLDRVEQTARPVPLTSQVIVDRDRVYGILDELRATLPEAITAQRWYRVQDEQADRTPAVQSGGDVLGVLTLIDEIDDLVHNGRPVPLDLRSVRVKRERLSEGVRRLRSVLAPLAAELTDSEARYPSTGDDEPDAERAPSALHEVIVLVESLEDLVHDAKAVPLTDEVRMSPGKVTTITRRLRSAIFREVLKPDELYEPLDRIDDLVERAPRGPFTDQIRIAREEIYGPIDALREAMWRLDADEGGDS